MPPSNANTPLTVTQIAAISGVSASHVRAAMRSGALKHTQVNSHLRVATVEQVEIWLRLEERTPVIPPREYLRRVKETQGE